MVRCDTYVRKITSGRQLLFTTSTSWKGISRQQGIGKTATPTGIALVFVFFIFLSSVSRRFFPFISSFLFLSTLIILKIYDISLGDFNFWRLTHHIINVSFASDTWNWNLQFIFCRNTVKVLNLSIISRIFVSLKRRRVSAWYSVGLEWFNYQMNT